MRAPLRLRRLTYGLATAHRRSSALNVLRRPSVDLAFIAAAHDVVPPAFTGSRSPSSSDSRMSWSAQALRFNGARLAVVQSDAPAVAQLAGHTFPHNCSATSMPLLTRRSPAFLCVALVGLSSCGGSGEPTTSPGNTPATVGGILYGAALGGGVAAYAINASNGVLTPIAGSPFAAEASEPAAFAMWLSANPARSVLYLAVASTNIEAWSANPTTGVPAATSGAPFAIALNGRIAVSPDGNRVYAPTGTGLATYSIGADGTLAAVDSRSDSPGAGAAAAVTPDGRFVYLASGPGQSRISTFSVSSATGALSPLAVNTLAPSDTTFPGDAGMAISPNGRFLYLSSRSTLGRIEAYTIASSTGGLSPVNGSPFASPGSPKELVLDPSGKFLFVATGSGVAAYEVDGATGALTAVAGSPFGSSGMAHVVVDASGHFLYATYLSSPIAAYTIDQTTGALSAIAGGPFGTGTGDLAILK